MGTVAYVPPAHVWGAPPLEVGQLAIPHDFPAVPAPPADPRAFSWLRSLRERRLVWWPLNQPQFAALGSPAQALLFGGQSGGGKSDFLVGDVIWRGEHLLPSFRGLLLKESLGDLDQLSDRMRDVYEPLGAHYKQRSGGGQWQFPSRAVIRFGYLKSESDLGRYRGNPRSWIGIDESGLQPEKRVRGIIPWLAAVDPRLHVRLRLTSNPGGMGHGWQMAAFLRNRCPLHRPADRDDLRPEETSVRAGYVYSGASWGWPPSPSNLLHMTTAFFPATVKGNPLYGPEKIKRLLSQTPEIQMQLLYGCWCNAESLYFGFLQPEWMFPYSAVEDRWWWNHFISIDYGYKNSSAAAGLFSVDENGRVFGTGEIVEKTKGAVDFAKLVAEKWIKRRMGEERPRMLFVTMDPAMDSHDDTGQSIFEKMAEVFAEAGVPSIKSHKSSADNAQILYNGLANRYFVLTDQMNMAFQSLATRVVDERRAVKKIHGDPADDLYDMVAYAYNTWLLEAVKPERLKMLERVKAMREQGADPTAIARWSLVEHARIVAEEQKTAQGLPLGRKRIGGLKVPRQ